MEKLFENVSVSPERILAGDSDEIIVRMTVKEDFVADGYNIVYDLPATLGFCRISLLDQEDNGYMAVFCSNPDIKYKKRIWDMETGEYAGEGESSFRGMAQRMANIYIEKGTFFKGDELLFYWGYARNGFGIGTKVSTLVPSLDFRPEIDIKIFSKGKAPFPDYGRNFAGYHRPEADEEHKVSLHIVAREPRYLRVFHQVNKTSIVVYDRFYNICKIDDIHDFINERVDGSFNSHGAFVINQKNVTITSKKLPLYAAPYTGNAYKDYNIYFGDIHTHSSASNDCIEREKMSLDAKACMTFAKEAACIDFHAVTDHHQPWDIERNKIQEWNWDKLIEATKEVTDKDFVALSGFEFRSPRGDTAVIFKDKVEYSKIDDSSMEEVNVLWDKLKGVDYITIPHFHMPGTLQIGEWIHNSDMNVEPALEIYSCHGSYEIPDAMERGTPHMKVRRPDRNAEYFLRKGYRYGLLCNSDGHKGNPGCNGLTAILAKDLTEESIFDAIRNRRVYGTTNARIKLVYLINDNIMGSIAADTDEKQLNLQLCGENRWKCIDVIYNGDVVKRYTPNEIEVTISDDLSEFGKGYYYIRATQIDNHIAYSSPIWFE